HSGRGAQFAGALHRARARGACERFARRALPHCAWDARLARRGRSPSQPIEVRCEASKGRRRRGSRRRQGSRDEGKRRKEIILDRKIDNVTAAKSLQKGGARRFAIRESGSRTSYFYRDEAGEEVSCGTDRLYCNRQIARRF